MAMNYTSLVASKATEGSIASWVNYSLLQPTVILEEAQALIYSLLRVREMVTELTFAMAVGDAFKALPSRFLDPIGRIRAINMGMSLVHKDMGFVKDARLYEARSGSLSDSPFATTSGSTSVNVTLTSHGFSQDSVFTTEGANLFNGVTIEGTFPITAIVSANVFTIDISSLGSTPSGTGSGGGSDATYTCDLLISGTPGCFAIYNERLNFDSAFTEATRCKLLYFQSLPLLSASNLTNFLTNRYPQLVRTACVTAAADFMKDDTEYNKGMTRLGALVQRINVENDGYMRGMDIDTLNP